MKDEIYLILGIYRILFSYILCGMKSELGLKNGI